jgi:ubiquinone/menaquinone biosynthesis C-methylase UbiE
MKISDGLTNKTCTEAEILNQFLSFDNKNILELGCGKAQITRVIATEGCCRTVTATEVDKIQHRKNLQIDDLPNVKFVFAGCQKLPFEDDSFDIILLFKSLHHVPMEKMVDALKEIKRVMKPGGLVYISEPIFAGDFNEILRLFHDEEIVRKAAFDTIVQFVERGDLRLVEEIFFNTPKVYKDFSEFEELIINVTHNNHNLSKQLMNQVEDKFNFYMENVGCEFLTPIRVDLLTK